MVCDMPEHLSRHVSISQDMVLRRIGKVMDPIDNGWKGDIPVRDLTTSNRDSLTGPFLKADGDHKCFDQIRTGGDSNAILDLMLNDAVIGLRFVKIIIANKICNPTLYPKADGLLLLTL
jgi:hypothetical protein